MRLTSGRAFRMFIVLKAMAQLEVDGAGQGQGSHLAMKDCLNDAKGGSSAKDQHAALARRLGELCAVTEHSEVCQHSWRLIL
jgi:hypothetical protein